MDIVSRSVQGSSLADLVWLDGAGAPAGCAVSPLLWDGRPAVAFTYARADLARTVAAAPVAALVLTETRSAGSSFAPAALFGRPSLVEDPDGTIFAAELLPQELRRYPPARVFADSPILQREHWWYLPRLILTLDIDAARSMPGRAGDPAEHLLAVAVKGRTGSRIEPYLVNANETAPAGSSGPDVLELTAVDGRTVPDGPAVLLGQDATFPDLSEWAAWSYAGVCVGGNFQVADRPAVQGLGPAPSVWSRWRRQRAFSRACREGIARAEASQRS